MTSATPRVHGHTLLPREMEYKGGLVYLIIVRERKGAAQCVHYATRKRKRKLTAQHMTRVKSRPNLNAGAAAMTPSIQSPNSVAKIQELGNKGFTSLISEVHDTLVTQLLYFGN